MSSTLSPAQFERLFDDPIRCLFNFERMRRQRWPVSCRVIDDRAALGALELPWRVKAGKLSSAGQGGRRLSVKEAAGLLHSMPADRRKAVYTEAAALVGAEASRAVVLPAIDDGRPTLLLDGAHRAVAAFLSGERFAFVLLVVRCPASAWAVVD